MLFIRELKKIVFSVPFVLFVLVMTLALYSQGVLDFSQDKLSQPQPGENYGTKNEEIPEIIMPAALDALYQEFVHNNYTTYPIGFYKNVKLNENQQMKMAQILSALTGVGVDAIYQSQKGEKDSGEESFSIEGGDDISLEADGNGSFVIQSSKQETVRDSAGQDLSIALKEGLSYREFKKEMEKADDMLGGGSKYAVQSLISFGTVPLTYEEALSRYELVRDQDRFTGGYARLFSDYACAMILSILPVFLGVLMSLKDKRAKMADLIYTTKISGARIILTRYAALLVSVLVPVILLSYISNASAWSLYSPQELDYLAPLKYDLGWLLPSVMISASLGMFLTELTNTPIAIAVQGLWWFWDMNINLGIGSTQAGYALLRLSPRHNSGTMSFFRTQDFLDNFWHLAANRLLFAAVSLLLIAGTMILYEQKRKGKLYGSCQFKKLSAFIKDRSAESQA